MGRRNGSTNAPAAERFWRFVTPLDGISCWIWKGALQNGYGAFQDDAGRQVGAHRFSYELHAGHVLPRRGLVVAHACDTRACVNPAHLVPTTQQANIRDMIRKGRRIDYRAQQTRCLRGHEYTAGNTVLYRGKRSCRECRNLRRRKSFLGEHFNGRHQRERNVFDSLRAGV